MTRELLLLRHGKSDWKAGIEDFSRPLKKRGLRGARLQGQWLKQQRIIPDLVLSSPAKRATETTTEFLQAVSDDGLTAEYHQPIYMASVDALLGVLESVDAKYNRVVMIGHNPGFEQLLAYLSSTPIVVDDGRLMPTATLARLSMPDDWHNIQQHCATLITLLRPNSFDI